MTDRPAWWRFTDAEILDHLGDAYPEEGCGLVTFDGSIYAFVPCANVAPASQRRFAFAIDPRDWMRAERGAVRVVAIVHSHPDGLAELSAEDRNAVVRDGVTLHPGVDHGVVAVHRGEPESIGIYRIDSEGVRELAAFTAR